MQCKEASIFIFALDVAKYFTINIAFSSLTWIRGRAYNRLRKCDNVVTSQSEKQTEGFTYEQSMEKRVRRSTAYGNACCERLQQQRQRGGFRLAFGLPIDSERKRDRKRSPSAAPLKGKINLVMWHQPTIDAVNAEIENYKKLHPEVDIEIIFSAFDQYYTTIQTQLIGGGAPVGIGVSPKRPRCSPSTLSL